MILIFFCIRIVYNLCFCDFVINIGFVISREKIIGRLKYRILIYSEELFKILLNFVLELIFLRVMFFEFLLCICVIISSNNRKFMCSRCVVFFFNNYRE